MLSAIHNMSPTSFCPTWLFLPCASERTFARIRHRSSLLSFNCAGTRFRVRTLFGVRDWCAQWLPQWLNFFSAEDRNTSDPNQTTRTKCLLESAPEMSIAFVCLKIGSTRVREQPCCSRVGKTPRLLHRRRLHQTPSSSQLPRKHRNLPFKEKTL